MRFHFSTLTFFICLCFLHLHVDAEPNLKTMISDVSCFGGKDGKIQLYFPGTPPSEFSISVMDSLNQKLAELNTIKNDSTLIEDLSAGSYSIQLIAPDMNENLIVKIGSPAKLKLELIKISKVEGSGTSALTTLQAFPSGGTPPYVYQWSENTGNQQGMMAKKLPLGIYKCTINDKNKCSEAEATFYLFEDEIESFKETENIK